LVWWRQYTYRRRSLSGSKLLLSLNPEDEAQEKQKRRKNFKQKIPIHQMKSTFLLLLAFFFRF